MAEEVYEAPVGAEGDREGSVVAEEETDSVTSIHHGVGTLHVLSSEDFPKDSGVCLTATTGSVVAEEVHEAPVGAEGDREGSVVAKEETDSVTSIHHGVGTLHVLSSEDFPKDSGVCLTATTGSVVAEEVHEAPVGAEGDREGSVVAEEETDSVTSIHHGVGTLHVLSSEDFPKDSGVCLTATTGSVVAEEVHEAPVGAEGDREGSVVAEEETNSVTSIHHGVGTLHVLSSEDFPKDSGVCLTATTGSVVAEEVHEAPVGAEGDREGSVVAEEETDSVTSIHHGVGTLHVLSSEDFPKDSGVCLTATTGSVVAEEVHEAPVGAEGDREGSVVAEEETDSVTSIHHGVGTLHVLSSEDFPKDSGVCLTATTGSVVAEEVHEAPVGAEGDREGSVVAEEETDSVTSIHHGVGTLHVLSSEDFPKYSGVCLTATTGSVVAEEVHEAPVGVEGDREGSVVAEEETDSVTSIHHGVGTLHVLSSEDFPKDSGVCLTATTGSVVAEEVHEAPVGAEGDREGSVVAEEETDSVTSIHHGVGTLHVLSSEDFPKDSGVCLTATTGSVVAEEVHEAPVGAEGDREGSVVAEEETNSVTSIHHGVGTLHVLSSEDFPKDSGVCLTATTGSVVAEEVHEAPVGAEGDREGSVVAEEETDSVTSIHHGVGTLHVLSSEDFPKDSGVCLTATTGSMVAEEVHEAPVGAEGDREGSVVAEEETDSVTSIHHGVGTLHVLSSEDFPKYSGVCLTAQTRSFSIGSTAATTVSPAVRRAGKKRLPKAKRRSRELLCCSNPSCALTPSLAEADETAAVSVVKALAEIVQIIEIEAELAEMMLEVDGSGNSSCLIDDLQDALAE